MRSTTHVQEGLDAVRDVIYFIETYDVNYRTRFHSHVFIGACHQINGIKMVLSGEGAMKFSGGICISTRPLLHRHFTKKQYVNFQSLHMYDCLRANKSLSAWGVEGRVPFLDKEFLDVAMNLNPKAKMCPEKTLRNELFAKPLPICYRKVWLGDRKSSSVTV